jgi:hypothetical protein
MNNFAKLLEKKGISHIHCSNHNFQLTCFYWYKKKQASAWPGMDVTFGE